MGGAKCTYENKEFAVNISKGECDYPEVYVHGNADSVFPHVMLEPDSEGWRYVCIRRNEQYINFLFSFDEKIKDLCQRIVVLFGLSSDQQHREWNKEFMFYWRSAEISIYPAEVFLGAEDNKFFTLNVYRNAEEAALRLVKPGIKLNDMGKRVKKRHWMHCPDFFAVYIPLVSADGLRPPFPNHRWDATYLLDILENNAYKYLPADCKEWLDIAKGKGLYIFFLLGIPINGRREFCLITKTSHTPNGVCTLKIQ